MWSLNFWIAAVAAASGFLGVIVTFWPPGTNKKKALALLAFLVFWVIGLWLILIQAKQQKAAEDTADIKQQQTQAQLDKTQQQVTELRRGATDSLNRIETAVSHGSYDKDQVLAEIRNAREDISSLKPGDLENADLSSYPPINVEGQRGHDLTAAQRGALVTALNRSDVKEHARVTVAYSESDGETARRLARDLYFILQAAAWQVKMDDSPYRGAAVNDVRIIFSKDNSTRPPQARDLERAFNAIGVRAVFNQGAIPEDSVLIVVGGRSLD